ncbi:MAG: DUF1501 domain-containing protein [Phycisphaeraceae bacterium]|nr:DUF1501 domain-containing protein [Phycisphaeraceae bacterium]
MDAIQEHMRLMTRRHFFAKSAHLGLGTAALGSLVGSPASGAVAGSSAAHGGLPGLPHWAPKAKRAIYLFMAGAPSQMDMYDYKPKMQAMFDKDLPDSVRKGQRLTTMTSRQKRFPIAPSKFKFEKCGKAGMWVSELLPHMKTIVDDIALIKSVYTEAINHDPAITYITTGDQLPGKASLGAWLSYGLGTENSNLPSFVVMTSSWTGRKQAQALFNRLWGSGFLPSKHQGVALRSKGDPVLYLSNPNGVDTATRRKMLDALARINQQTYEQIGDPEIHSRIAAYEMAFKMQASVPELVDLSGESKATLEMYGPDVTKKGTFAYHCLLARRMAERGVRFTQIFHRGWDQHKSLPRDLPNQCRDIDQPCAALIKDLKQRGLLEDTLVVWGGEFGRTIYCQGKLTKDNYGRDHHPRCFPVWMAGAGIQGGVVHGETDDFSYNIVRDPVHIRDMNATILDRLGIDHERLSVKHQGLQQRLTGVEPSRVVREIIA